MAILSNWHDLASIILLETLQRVRMRIILCSEVHSRSAADAEYVELSLVKTHIAQCQTGKQTRQKDKDGDKDNRSNGHWIVRVNPGRTTGNC